MIPAGLNLMCLSGGFLATGGTITEDATYRYHTFTTSGTFQVLQGSVTGYAWVLGGGSGGTCTYSGGSWPGAGGGCAEGAMPLNPGSYAVTVGAGSPGGVSTSSTTTAGGNSSFNGLTGNGGQVAYPSGGNITATQGGTATGGTTNTTGGNGPRSGTSGNGAGTYGGAGVAYNSHANGNNYGAGGSGADTPNAGAGANGVVVIRYPK